MVDWWQQSGYPFALNSFETRKFRAVI